MEENYQIILEWRKLSIILKWREIKTIIIFFVISFKFKKKLILKTKHIYLYLYVQRYDYPQCVKRAIAIIQRTDEAYNITIGIDRLVSFEYRNARMNQTKELQMNSALLPPK